MSFETITAKEYRELPKKKPSKYHNKKVEYDGYKFGSIKEMERYIVLLGDLRLNKIDYLIVHPKYLITPKCGKSRAQYYEADFEYMFIKLYPDGFQDKIIVEDVKPIRKKTSKFILTRVYINNKKAMKHLYNIDVKEV